MFVFLGTHSQTKINRNIGIGQLWRSMIAEETWFSSVLQQDDEKRKWLWSIVVAAWFGAISFQNNYK